MPSSASDNHINSQVRSYERAQSIVFLKTKEAFGGLSNMAGGFPLRVNGIRIFSAEALYQACRFPHLPDVQRLVLSETSPMTAKMKTKPYRKDSRSDWDQVRVRIMRWCLRVKLVQNWNAFGELLLATEDKSIVEESYKDDFWGAKPVDQNTLVGMNVLGRLLMELREEFKSDPRDALLRIEPLQIPDFLLMGQPIPVIEAMAQDNKRLVTGTEENMKSVGQHSLFDQPPLIAEPMRAVNEKMPQPYAATKAAFVDLQPYPEYRDSGLPWLGQVPGHWEMRRGKFLFRNKKILNSDRAHKNVLSLTLRGVVNNDPDNPEGLVPKDYGTYQLFSKGDLVFKLIDLENLRTSRVGLVHEDGIMSSAYVRLAPTHNGLQRFFYQQYFDLYQRGIFNQLGAGVRSTLGPTDLLNLSIALPQLEEQTAIVRYLDHATHRLDRAIRAKRKTIALLNEQKQAIIHRAVTRGIDPDVPLKDSGLPWLGQIPVHWEVRRVKQTSKILRGKFTHRPRNDASLYDGPYPFIQTGAVAQAKKFITSYKQTLNQKGLSVSKMFPAGTLVMTIAANIGDVAILTFDACFPDSIVGFVPAGKINRDYLHLAFCCMKPELLREAPVNTQGNLNIERIGAMGIPLPLLEEQTAIVHYVESETSSLGSVVSRIEREIELLREYRTRLIADVVTGKLDVREAAAKLPEESAPDVAENATDMCDEAESTDEDATV